MGMRTSSHKNFHHVRWRRRRRQREGTCNKQSSVYGCTCGRMRHTYKRRHVFCGKVALQGLDTRADVYTCGARVLQTTAKSSEIPSSVMRRRRRRRRRRRTTPLFSSPLPRTFRGNEINTYTHHPSLCKKGSFCFHVMVTQCTSLAITLSCSPCLLHPLPNCFFPLPYTLFCLIKSLFFLSTSLVSFA